METLGLKPGLYWGTAAAISEFGGGALTAMGFLNPLGPIGILSAMTMGAVTVHWGKPIWVTEGGAEFAVTNGVVALSSALSGPGKYSLDRALGIRLPLWAGMAAGAVAAAAVAYGLAARSVPPPATDPEQA